MKKFFNNLHRNLTPFWFPILIISIPIIVLVKFDIISQDKETFRTVLGITLGVVLSFGAYIAKQRYDEVINKNNLRKASLRLLCEDAKHIYRIVYLQNNSLPPDKNISSTDITPPNIDLRYWKTLKTDKDFLLQAADFPFNEIFKLFGDFEKINELIAEGERKRNQNYSDLANKWYQDAWKLDIPKKLLLHFIEEKEFNSFSEKVIADAKV